jgi:hypothetical protein
MTPAADHRPTPNPKEELRSKLLRVNSRAWGVSVGTILGLWLFVATNVLVLKGGEVVGPHLGQLGLILPGYRVTVAGSFIGFVYLFVIGYGLGRLISTIYNSITHRNRVS